MKKVWPTIKWLLIALAGLVVWNITRNAYLFILAPLSEDVISKLEVWVPAIVGVSGVLATWLGFHLLYRWTTGKGLQQMGVSLENWRADVLIGLGVGLLIGLSTFLEIALKGVWGTDTLQAAQSFTGSPGRLISGLIAGILFGGVAEELYYRGHVIYSLRNLLGNHNWSVVVAATISAIMFGMAHGHQGTVGIIATGVFGAGYAILYLWRKRLTASIVAHATADVVGILIVYFVYPMI